MKRKKILKDPGFWILAGINIYLIWYYYHVPQVFTTLIWLYWCQSVMMGLFNCFDILTVRTIETSPGPDGKEKPKLALTRVGAAVFFAVHYGFFHFVYLMFITSGMKPKYPINWELFRYFMIAFFIGQVFTFVQHKIQQRKAASNIGAMFFLPYLRILPMHFTILIPAFFPGSHLGIFLILKGLADIAMYIATKPRPATRAVDETLLASQQTMNM